MAKAKKFFVLDTNVVLHDSNCLYEFGKNDVVIPITVIEELDKFKKGNEIINYHARKFLRTLDNLSNAPIFRDGVSISKDLGKLIIHMEAQFHPDLAGHFAIEKPDHRILNSAYSLAKEHGSRKVMLISKDVNLRMKAKAMGLAAEDFATDQAVDIGAIYTGKQVVENAPKRLVDAMYRTPFEIEASKFKLKRTFLPNEYMILKGKYKSALATFHSPSASYRRVDKRRVSGIKPRNSEQTFALHALMDPEIRLVTLSGKAGTGKTLLALSAAIERRKYYSQIYLARPIVPLSNKDIGYLPGDIRSKLDPYMQPLFDNLGVIQNQYSQNEAQYQRIKELVDNEILKISPLSYIRGRSLVKVYFIIDEAQNLTPHEVKTIVTRAGEGTKVVFTGDIFQIDHPYLDSQSNGLSHIIEKLKGQPLYAHINLEKGERSELAELASDIL